MQQRVKKTCDKRVYSEIIHCAEAKVSRMYNCFDSIIATFNDQLESIL